MSFDFPLVMIYVNDGEWNSVQNVSKANAYWIELLGHL
jgi:hypothetical protein